MRTYRRQRGHQQDAEEFLGFVLEEMHEECARVMKPTSIKPASGASTPTNGDPSPVHESSDLHALDDGGWLEVGPKQKAAITRSSGPIATESPVTKIFGGKLRSEFRVPGMKNSVTLEPYQPLQLDIGAANVSNIVDALKGLTKPEPIHGDFNSPRGPNSTATKQVFIETLPQVLILHLKRFQYDSNGGTQKIWKKVGYPLDLEIPKEVFPQHKRGGLLAHGGLPKYRLISVVYHHGKNASGGHYTVDVRRQEGREWIRLDDTVIRRVRSQDVAEGGSEEDPQVLAAALEQHKIEEHQSSNTYEQFTAEDEEQREAGKGWSQVNGMTATPSTGGKKWSGVANGNVTPNNVSGKITPVGRASVKDNKVAYILFYQRVNA
jgi:ubiquitin carboxyl-terminal hydrolase 10